MAAMAAGDAPRIWASFVSIRASMSASLCYDVIDEADGMRRFSRKLLAGQKIFSGVRSADSSHNKWTDQCRDNAQIHLGESELRVFSGDTDIACRHEAGASPQCRAMDSRDHGFGTANDGQKHLNRSVGIAPVFFRSEAGDTFVQFRSAPALNDFPLP